MTVKEFYNMCKDQGMEESELQIFYTEAESVNEDQIVFYPKKVVIYN